MRQRGLGLFLVSGAWLVLAGGLMAGEDSGVVRIGAIRVEGNVRTHESVILQELRLKEGDVYAADVVRDAAQRVMNLRYFSEVGIDAQETGQPGVVDLVVTVKERWTLGVTPSVSLEEDSTSYGFSVSESNLFGLGKSISFSTSWGERDATATYTSGVEANSYSLEYYDRHLFGSDVFLDIGALVGSRVDEQEVGGVVTVRNDEDLKGGWLEGGYRFSYYPQDLSLAVGVSTFDEEYESRIGSYQPEEGRTNKAWLAAAYDGVAFHLDSLEGASAGVQLEKGATGLGGDFSFEKVSIGAAYYVNPYEDHTWSVQARFRRGWDLPDHELWSVGGAGNLRGYSSGSYVGNKAIVASTEYWIPVWRPRMGDYSFLLRVHAFVDTGYAWPEEDGIGLSDLETSVGAGFKFQVNEVSFASFRVDLAYGIDPEEFEVYLSFGN